MKAERHTDAIGVLRIGLRIALSAHVHIPLEMPPARDHHAAFKSISAHRVEATVVVGLEARVRIECDVAQLRFVFQTQAIAHAIGVFALPVAQIETRSIHEQRML